MASAYNPRPQDQMAYPGSSYHPAAQPAMGHPGMFSSGTKVQVGQHRVIVEKYLSEGGFAHVYVVRIPRSDGKFGPAVLKRVAVPDKDTLANMRTEVETMKKLKGHRKIVSYIDSHASQMKGGGYEVFLLMEYCQGGGLIDFMNTRLQHRLTEPEILKIFSDVAEGVAAMHYLKSPLLHRDLKVENVLISTSGSRAYKLCDFGSSAPPRPAAKSAQEARLIEDDVQRHTTMQYRSPEMIDVYRKQPIDEKADIWALGVLLYKLCYYTTPFEEQGQMAILNASFKFPHHPSFSDRLRRFISSMLKENPASRPNIYQVVQEVCSMRNTEVPIKDIYTGRSKSEARRHEELPSREPKTTSPNPVIGLEKVEYRHDDSADIPDIAPMRRGRPTASSQLSVPSSTTPATSRPSSTDPFAALDAKLASRKGGPPDELAGRFPTLDQFSLLHDKGNKFEFDQTASEAAQVKEAAPDPRMTNTLADEAFGQLRHAKSAEARPQRIEDGVAKSPSLKQATIRRQFETASRPTPQLKSPVVSSPQSRMVSTGVQTSPASSPTIGSQRLTVSSKPIWRVPTAKSPALDPNQDDGLLQRRLVDKALPPRPEPLTRPGFLSRNRTKSQTMQLELPTSPVSSRPSLEGGRPSLLEVAAPNTVRSRSANAQLRQISANVDSAAEYMPESGDAYSGPRSSRYNNTSADNSKVEDDINNNQESAAEYLRNRESDDTSRPKSSRRRSSSLTKKRLSLPAISLTGTRNMLSGRFGDAFRRFESSNSGNEELPADDNRQDDELLHNRALSPIAGSDRTGNSGGDELNSPRYQNFRPRDDEEALDETEDVSPEVRRELERRRLSQEEKRVAAAAAEYRQRLQKGGVSSAGPRQVSSIQSRIQNMVEQNRNTAPPPRTAEGYGKFTDEPATRGSDRPVPAAKKPFNVPSLTKSTTAPSALEHPPSSTYSQIQPRPAATLPLRTGLRPNVAPKPQALRTGSPSLGLSPRLGGTASPLSATAYAEEDFSESSFTNKFPSLAGLEMVDMDLQDADDLESRPAQNGTARLRTTNGMMRVRDV